MITPMPDKITVVVREIEQLSEVEKRELFERIS
jgi:hypothetical protein